MSQGFFEFRSGALIIAEIGNNHEGDFALARDLVARAADAGADAVKFQTFRPEHYVSRNDTARFERLQGFQFSEDQFTELATVAREAGLLFGSTPFDLASAHFLGGLVDFIKIASGDNTFYPLIEVAAASAKPMIFSTGLADHTQISRAKQAIDAVWGDAGVTPGLAILHCVASYPVPETQANLRAIPALAEAFPDVAAGYSDHTAGITAALAAVSLGARVIEKHFTIDNNYSDFRDHQLSADPETLKHLVAGVREVEAMLGNGDLGTQPCESDGIEAMRRSIVARHDIPAGTTIGADDITWVRPGGGIPPGDEDKVVGRTAKRDITADAMVNLDDVS